MRTICSYCRKVISGPEEEGKQVSHGMCESCRDYFEDQWHGLQLGPYLDRYDRPIMVVDGNGRLVTFNQAMATSLDIDRQAKGLLGGEFLECAYARLPAGCGKTTHCKCCTIRRLVEQVRGDGQPVEHEPAYLHRPEGTYALRLSVRPHDRGSLLVVVEGMERAERNAG